MNQADIDRQIKALDEAKQTILALWGRYQARDKLVDELEKQNNQTTTSNFPCNFNFTVSNMNRFNQGIDHG